MKKDDQPFRFQRVLLIDDNDIDNFINERMITTTNFSQNVVVKTTGEAALDYLRNTASAELLPQEKAVGVVAKSGCPPGGQRP